MYSSIQQFYIEWQPFNKRNRLKRNDRNIQKGRRTQWFIWKYWVALTKICEKPQTTVTTATHVLSHILSPWPQSVTQWACVLVTSTKVDPGMNPFPVAVYRPDSVPKTLSGSLGCSHSQLKSLIFSTANLPEVREYKNLAGKPQPKQRC